jgi:hypothetical protein
VRLMAQNGPQALILLKSVVLAYARLIAKERDGETCGFAPRN